MLIVSEEANGLSYVPGAHAAAKLCAVLAKIAGIVLKDARVQVLARVDGIIDRLCPRGWLNIVKPAS